MKTISRPGHHPAPDEGDHAEWDTAPVVSVTEI